MFKNERNAQRRKQFRDIGLYTAIFHQPHPKAFTDFVRRLGQEATAEMADRIKDVGFRYATRSGTSIAMSDLIVPSKKHEILEEAEKQVGEVERQFRRGLLTDDEQYTRTIELWTDARDEITDAVSEVMDPKGPIFVMASSGSTKGGFTPISQLAGMRGLMADPSGRIIDLPIRSSFREGLTALEYFISTHGSRNGPDILLAPGTRPHDCRRTPSHRSGIRGRTRFSQIERS